MNRRFLMTIPLVVAALGSSGAAAADEEIKKLEIPKSEYLAPAKEDERRPGLDWQVGSGATLTFSDNRAVIGQTDGSTLIFGFKLDVLTIYNQDEHEWRNTLAIGAGLARTAIVDDFVKSRDALGLESIYLYHYTPWFGPYGRFVVDTAMFRGTDVRPAPVTYSIARVDGTTDTTVGERLATTDPFQPLTLKESLGPFVRPVVRDEINLELRAGLGGRQTFADQQLALNDDAATADVIEVKELENVFQVGVEVAAQVWGELSAKKVLYRLTAEAMTPFAHSALPAGDDRGAFDLTNIGIAGTLSFKLVEWASVDYELRVVREPQLIDAFQVQNNLLATFSLTAGNIPEEELPPCKP